MARGYPDFFGYPIAPNYGVTTAQIHAAKVVAAGDSYNLLDLDIKGRTVGGKLFLNTASLEADQYVDLWVDGVRIDQICGQCEDIYGSLGSPNRVLLPVRVDHSKLYYEYAFKADIVVNYSLILTMVNAELVDDYMGSVTLIYNGYEAG
jgi:hypothetical protein